MVVRYVKRRLILTFACVVGACALLLGALQITYIQKCILKTFVVGDFDRISGIFPFKFSVYNLKLRVDNTNVFADTISIKLNKKLNKVKSIDINSLSIDSPKSQLNSIDFKPYLPIFTQTFVRKLDIGKVIYNRDTIGALHISMAPKLHSSNIFFETHNNKKIMITTKIADNILHLRSSFENFSANVSYNLHTDEISTGILRENQEIVTMHGILKSNSLSGILTAVGSNQSMAFKASVENNSIFIDAYCEYANGMSMKAEYDLDVNKICVHELNIGKKIFCKPFVVEDDFKIQNLEIVLPKGKIVTTNIDLNSDTFNLGQWKFENIDISALQDGNRDKISGFLNGLGCFKDGVEHFNLNLSNVEYGVFKLPLIKVEGEYSKNKLKLEILYNILKKVNSISITADPINWIINDKTKISVSAKGAFILEDSIRKISKQVIRGKLKYNLSIDGAISDPRIAGSLTIKDAVYINKASDTFLKNGFVEASIKDNNIIISKISATDDLKSPGQLTGSGRIVYKDGEPIVDVNIQINALEAMAMREFDGKLFGVICIKGNLAREIKITGDLYSNSATFDISNFVNMSNYSMEILDSIKTKPKNNVKEQPNIKIPLDIKFKFVPNLHIVGFGVDSTWKGGATIKGDTSNINYNFETTLENGTIDVAGKKFTLKNGRVSCSNKTNGTVNVDISATKTIEKRKVGARFLQDKDGSDVVFFSKPYASKNDVLSYMLFEKSASEISAGEALTLLSVMGKVSGKGSLDVVDKIKTVFGVDSIEIKKHNNEDTGDGYNAISIGKKIGKLKISVDKGADKDTTSVFVEAEVAKNTKFSVDMGGANNFGGGLLWGKRY